MMRWIGPMMMLGVLAAAPSASADCRRFGTQLDCGVAGSRVVIGTQTAAEPSDGRSLAIQSFHGGSGFPDARAAPRQRFAVQLQDFGTDPSLCRSIGNEIYCY